MSRLRKFLFNDDGPTSVEYAVMLAMIIAVCIVGIQVVGNQTSGIWASNDEKLGDVGF